MRLALGTRGVRWWKPVGGRPATDLPAERAAPSAWGGFIPQGPTTQGETFIHQNSNKREKDVPLSGEKEHKTPWGSLKIRTIDPLKDVARTPKGGLPLSKNTVLFAAVTEVGTDPHQTSRGKTIALGHIRAVPGPSKEKDNGCQRPRSL